MRVVRKGGRGWLVAEQGLGGGGRLLGGVGDMWVERGGGGGTWGEARGKGMRRGEGEGLGGRCRKKRCKK